MCRMVAYLGRPIAAADVVTRPSRSIIRQSYDARERLCAASEQVPASLNGDGYGIGWYSSDGAPCVYKSIRPAWNDANLHHLAEKGIRSRVVFAHVRAATAGTSVTEESCHPFTYSHYMFAHNGAIAGWQGGRVRRALLNQLNDECYEFAVRHGASDSLVAFALFLNQMERGTAVRYDVDAMRQMLLRTIEIIVRTVMEAGRADNAPSVRSEVSLLNFVVSNGEALVATRYAFRLHDAQVPAASLYFASAAAYTRLGDAPDDGASDYTMSYGAATRCGVVLVASEPLTARTADWVPFPRNSVLVVTRDLHLLLEQVEIGDVAAPACHLRSRISVALEYLLAGEMSSMPNGEAAADASLAISPMSLPEAHSTDASTEPFVMHQVDELIEMHHTAVLTLALHRRAAPPQLPAAQDIGSTPATWLLFGAQDGSVSVWDTTSMCMVERVRVSDSSSAILGLAVMPTAITASPPPCPSSTRLAVISTDNCVRLFNIAKSPFTLAAEWRLGHAGGHPLSLATCGRRLYLGFQDGSVQAMPVDTDTPTEDALGDGDGRGEAGVAALSLSSPQKPRLFGGAAASLHCGPVYCLAVSVFSGTLFTGSGDASIKVWDIASGACRATLRGHRGAVLTLVADDARGHRLYSGARDGSIRVWDTGAGAAYLCRRTLDAGAYHPGDVSCLAMASSWLFSGSSNGVILVWRQSDLQCVARLMVPGASAVAALLVVDEERPSHIDADAGGAGEAARLYASCADGHICGWSLDGAGRLCGGIATARARRELGWPSAAVAAEAPTMETPSEWSMPRSPMAADLPLARLSLTSPTATADSGAVMGMEVLERALRTAVRFRSISGGGDCHPFYRDESFRCAKWLAHLLQSIGADVTLSQPVEARNPVVLARIWSAGAAMPQTAATMSPVPSQTVVFYGHYDVVPAHGTHGWRTDPFDLSLVDGYYYGRGTTDNKGPILAMILAVAEWQMRQRARYRRQEGGNASLDRVPTSVPSGEIHTNVVLILDGEEESASEGFREAVLSQLPWLLGVPAATAGAEAHANGVPTGSDAGAVERRMAESPVACILHANSLWVGDDRPCITYGMRGTVTIEVEVRGAARNLHSGTEGGAVIEPAIDLVSVLGTLVDTHGTPAVPGFFDGVLEPDARELAAYDEVDFDAEAYRQRLGVPALAGKTPRDILRRRWGEPCLSITNITTSVAGGDTGNGVETIPLSATGVTPASGHSADPSRSAATCPPSVIPRSASAVISVRTVPHQDPERVRRVIEQHLRFEFGKRRSPNQLRTRCIKQGDWWFGDVHGSSEHSPPNGTIDAASLFTLVEQSIEQVWHTRPLYVREGGSMPLTSWLERLFRANAVHVPLGQASDAPHLPNERIRALNLLRGKEVLRHVLERIDQGHPCATA
ncbi:hypothetical protein CDCA_CDCA02G0563 [Cyanidium caldarium]|uniref:Glutamine amidotransferase type-2 domain-containing protein n=1 Tax=Cyanidium caldarium TaxID=2771 RepID=A0AAV9IQK6_CYACA|nr:hypothetical protein CDCA_CDCA02G0563 [Cyanidium caldarium]